MFTGVQPLPTPPSSSPRFQGSPIHLVERWFVSPLNRILYEKGDGFRYAVEQTLGYTVPRTSQQWNRTKELTGKENKMAAYEMLMRDLGADFADTFLPGLIVHFGGKILDWLHFRSTGNHTFIKRKMDSDTLAFYQHLASQSNSRQEFVSHIEQALKNGMKLKYAHPSMGLDHLLEQLKGNKRSVTRLSQILARRIGLHEFDIRLSHQSLPKIQPTIGISDLLEDMHAMLQHKLVVPQGSNWGQEMSSLLTKTVRKSKYQIVANLVALGCSIAIPFAIRLITRHVYGHDVFPGTEELRKHFFHHVQHHPQDTQKKEKPPFRPFPYLHDKLKEGKYWPTALTLGYFGVLGLAVLRRFHLKQASIFKAKDWLKVYEFGRAFPWTTTTQMELTYGMLCGIRLATSRDGAEFRESGIRDCLLGWPTLTYFFPEFRKFLSHRVDRYFLKRRVPILNKTDGEVRSKAEMMAALFKTKGIGSSKEAREAVHIGRRAYNWITLGTGFLSWLLLAYAEPKLGIEITNRMEVKKLKAQKAETQKLHQILHQSATPVPQQSIVQQTDPAPMQPLPISGVSIPAWRQWTPVQPTGYFVPTYPMTNQSLQPFWVPGHSRSTVVKTQ